MVSTASPLIRFEEIGTGDKLNTWGVALNAALELIETSAHGYVSVAVTSAAQSLTVNNFIADQARYKSVEFTSALTANSVITIPSVAHHYMIKNSTTNTAGPWTLTIKTAAGAGAVIRQNGLWFAVVCDGTNTYVLDMTLDQIKAAAADVDLGTHKVLNLVAGGTGTTNAANVTQVETLIAAKSLSNLGTVPTAKINTNSQQIGPIADGTANSQDAASVNQMQAAILVATIPAGNGMVRVDVADTTNGFLGAKLPVTLPIVKTINNAGANETLSLSVNVFTGATSGVAGATGVVPAPTAGQQTYVLRGDSTWVAPGAVPYAAKTANYTVLGADISTVIDCTANSFTLTLTAPATLGASWTFYPKNTGTGIVAITPASGQIDGRSTINLYPGEAFLVECDGSNFRTVGRKRKGDLVLMKETVIGSTVSTVDFTGFTDTEIGGFELELLDVQTNSTASPCQYLAQIYVNGSLQTAASYGTAIFYNSGTTPTASASTAATSVEVLHGLASSNDRGSAVIVIPALTPTVKTMYARGTSGHTGSNAPQVALAAGSFSAVGTLDGVRLLLNSTYQFTAGTVRLYGRRV